GADPGCQRVAPSRPGREGRHRFRTARRPSSNPRGNRAVMKSQRTTEADADDRQYLVFSLGKEEYAIDILKVEQIRGYDQVPRIVNGPDFIKGVSNLRGIIVPIVELRIKFRLEDIRYDEHTVVIVVDIDERVIGIVVEGVSDVMTLTQEKLR